MSQENITVLVDSEKIEALDAIAAELDCDRNYAIELAITAYLEIYQWQIEEIKKGIAEAEAGDFASEEETQAVFAKLTHAH